MIVAIDNFSGYMLMNSLQAETAESVISSLNFRRFGLSESIIPDNGTCFRSQMFHIFCQSLELNTSHPLPTTMNGMAVQKGLFRPLDKYSGNAALRLK